MRLLLDTTYLLPTIGISVRGLPEDALIQLIRRGHQVSISEIAIFELSAKGAKQITLGTLTAERASRGLRAVVYDDRIRRIPIQDGSVLLTAFRLRKVLNDFVDCLILSSAMNQNDVLVTEDEDIHDLRERRDFQEILQTTNPRFEVQRVRDVL